MLSLYRLEASGMLKTITQAMSYTPVPCNAIAMPQGKPCKGGDAELPRDKASKLRTTPERGCCYGNAALNSDNVWSIKSTNDPKISALSSALKELLGVFTLLFPSFGDGSGQEKAHAGVERQQQGSSLPQAQQDITGRGQTWPQGLALNTTEQWGKLVCL